MGEMENSGSVEEEEGVPDDVTLVGVNRMECIEGMTKEDIAWESGMDWEKFQESSDACLVSESFARESGITVGEDMQFDLERYSQGLAGVTLTREELTPEVFHVAGTYKEIQGRDGGNPDVLLPLDVVKSIYERNDIVYFASALSFKAADLMRLDELKRELEDAGLKEIIYGSPNSYVGISVKLTDSVFIRSMESADRSRVLLESFLPFIFLIVAADISSQAFSFRTGGKNMRSCGRWEPGDISVGACSLRNISCRLLRAPWPEPLWRRQRERWTLEACCWCGEHIWQFTCWEPRLPCGNSEDSVLRLCSRTEIERDIWNGSE